MLTTICAMLLSFVGASSTTQSHDYADAYKLALADSHRPLVVLVGADWCPACRQMKQTVLPQIEAGGGLDKVAFAVVNTDREKEVANQLMEGTSIPQLIMFVKTDTGWERTQLRGGQSVESVESFIAQGLNRPLVTTASTK